MTTQILVLKGVRVSDLNNAPTRSTPVPSKVYTELPEEFTGVSTWAKYTNLKCWHCGRTFKEYPKFIPVNPKKSVDGSFVCGVQGVFHTWNCAAAHAAANTSERTNRETQRLICLVESMFTGKLRSYVPLAPPKTRMKEYCGAAGLTHTEYDELISEIDVTGTIYLTQAGAVPPTAQR